MNLVRSLLAAVLTLAGVTSAHAQCPTSADITIQNAISAAAAAGGGTVQLETGIYQICQPVVLASNVHLRGRGIGATVLQTLGGPPTGPLGVFGASIVGAGIANASVVGLTLDQRTSGRVANGIAIVPGNADFSGTVSNNILIERNQVLGAPVDGGHQYMIWNMRGQNVKIVNNWVDGGFTAEPSVALQEGIEVFGGYDVLVEGNTVRGIGGTCLNFGSAIGVPNTHTVGLSIRNNYAFQCKVGINIGGADQANLNAHSIVAGNIIIYAWTTGISVYAGPGQSERDLQIRGNTIRGVGPGGASAVCDGILLFAVSGSPITTTVEGNQIDTVQGRAFGIRLESYSNARILNNSILNPSREGIYASNSNNLEVRGNRIQGAGLRAIYSGPAVQAQIVTDNLIIDWGVASDGIRLDGVNYGVVRDNLFKRADAARPAPVVMGAGTCGIAVAGNVALYAGAINNGSPPGCS
jgi:parallel beta-helix repeat protein